MKDYVLLAAGKGTRLWPITENKAKVMVRVLEKPIIEWTVENIYHDARKIIIVANEFKEQLIEHFTNSKYKDKIKFVQQKEPNGTGDAILSAEREVETNFFTVIYADGFYDPNAFKMIAKEKEAFILGKKVEDGKKLRSFNRN